MKNIFKKIFQLVLILIISILLTYLLFTIKDFYLWYNNNMQFSLLNSPEEQLSQLNKENINELGEIITNLSVTFNNSLSGTEYEEYNSTGISAWYVFQIDINNILNANIDLALLFGVIITIAYIVITNRKITNMLKLIIGYLGIIIIVPPIYVYIHTGRFWNLATMYIYSMPEVFYIIYTILFVIIFIINYKANLKLVKELNKTIDIKK